MSDETTDELTPKHKLALRLGFKLVRENDTGYEERDIATWPEWFLYEWLGDNGFEWTETEWKYWGTA